MNAIYAGKVEHRGTTYLGEHPAIIEPALWDEVNAAVAIDRREPTTTPSTPQNALLAGLLICASCQRSMVATYTLKRGRRYRYYVCRTARQRGWDACPTKSVPAAILEDSVVSQVRAALNAGQLPIASESEWQDLLEGDAAGLIRTIVEEIRYEGSTGAVSLKLRSIQDAN